MHHDRWTATTKTLIQLAWIAGSSLVLVPASAQGVAPAPAVERNAAAASAPQSPAAGIPATTPPVAGPRLSTPAEQRESATPPGDLGPTGSPPPLINIPLGKSTPAAAAVTTPGVRRDNSLPANAIDDEAARCQAQPNAAAKDACHAEIARRARKH